MKVKELIVHSHSRENRWKSYCNETTGYFDILWDLKIDNTFTTLDKYNMDFRLP